MSFAAAISSRFEFLLTVSNATSCSTSGWYDASQGKGSAFHGVRIADHRKEFAPGPRIFAKSAQHHGRHHSDTGFVNAARRHALMRGFDHYGHAFWFENLLDTVRDLRTHFFLHLQPSSIGIDNARQFGDADDFPRRQISHMRTADDRCQMM